MFFFFSICAGTVGAVLALGLVLFIAFKMMPAKPKLCHEVMDEWFLFVKGATDEAHNHGYRFAVAFAVVQAADKWTTWSYVDGSEDSCLHYSGKTSVSAISTADFIRDKSNWKKNIQEIKGLGGETEKAFNNRGCFKVKDLINKFNSISGGSWK